MTSRPLSLAKPVGVALGLLLLAHPAQALMRLNDNRDKVFVNWGATWGFSSNIFANSQADGSGTTVAFIGADYQRRAGLISMDLHATMNFGFFADFEEQNYHNPSFGMELHKETGRTTGTLALNASRENRADSSANLRSSSWNYGATLNVRYPVVDRYNLVGTLGYNLKDYADNTVLVDLDTISAALDMYYNWRDDRDLVAGYRFRRSQTSRDSSFRDHSINIGMTGRILPRLNGSTRVGWQQRTASPSGETFSSWTANISTTWNVTKKTSVTGFISKDFNTTSTNATVDSISAGIDLQHAFSSRLTGFAGVYYGNSEFLEVDSSAARVDTYFSWSVGGRYNFREWLYLSVDYTYFINWSTLSFSDYERYSYSFSIGGRF